MYAVTEHLLFAIPSTPVGVDFYVIGDEKGDQYGPWGVLYPVQDPPGRYVFQCDTTTKVAETAMCMNLTTSVKDSPARINMTWKENPFNEGN